MKNIDNSKYIANKLEKLFPSKKYDKISDISKFDGALYRMINEAAKIQNLKVEQYLKSLSYTKNISEHVKIYDLATMKKLISNYNIYDSKFSEFIECSRENIGQKFRKNISKHDGLWLQELDSYEIETIINLLKETKTEILSGEFFFILLTNKENPSLKSILIKNKGVIKCVFDLPKEIIKILNETYLDDFKPEQIQFNEELNFLWINQGKKTVDKKKLLNLGKELRNRANYMANLSNMSLKDYLDLLDFTYEDKRFMSEEEIKEKISKYVCNDNEISLTASDEDYNFFARTAHRRGLELKDFFASYGYDYKRGHTVEDPLINHKQTIIERYVIQNNEIYIPSADPFYGTLAALSHNRKVAFDSLVQEMGFVRINHKRDLPKWYTPYKFSLDDSFSDENIIRQLKLLENDNGDVYLDTKSYFYYKVFLLSQYRAVSINNLISSLGFNRIYKSDVNSNNKTEELENKLIMEKEEYISNSLRELNNIESEYKINPSKSKILERNKKLVREMKKLYQYKCQICKKNEIPEIEKSSGEFYVEVHHITAFSQSLESDIDTIDFYKNTIVVCPHHHKVLHYHHGGYSTLVKSINEVHLENDYGEKLKLHINYHL